jgi:hypothetical protein
MVREAEEIFADWKGDNYETIVELDGLGDVGDLLARIWPIFVNSVISSSVISNSD